MSAKPVVPRDRARRDFEDAVDYYAHEAGEQIALHFIDATERAFRAIANHPAAGSPRYAYELDLPGLHTWPVKRHPYLIFYIEQEHHIDVWRILHMQRDIPAWMQDSANI